jgi:hypothetical protein
MSEDATAVLKKRLYPVFFSEPSPRRGCPPLLGKL